MQKGDVVQMTMHSISCAILSGVSWATLHRVFICSILSQEYLGQHWTGFFLCSVVWSLLDNIAQDFYQCYVGPWLTDNFYEENNLYNVVLTMLGQHYIVILFIQCCPNMSEKTLHKKNICAMLAQSTQTCFRRKITYTVLPWSACT